MMDTPKPRIEDWFFAFAARHALRCQKPGWPKIDPGGAATPEAAHFFAAWIKEFKAHGVSEHIADVASIAMAAKDYPYPGGEHLQVFMKHVQAAWDAARIGAAANTREACGALSAGCLECGGGVSGGMTARKIYVGPREANRIASVSLYCACPIGEWLALHHFHNDKSTYNRMRRLIMYPELWNPFVIRERSRGWPEAPRPRRWALESWWVPCDWTAYGFPPGTRIDLREVGIAS